MTRTISRNMKLIGAQGGDGEDEDQIQEAHGVPDAFDAGKQATDEDDGEAGHESLDGAGENQAEDEVGFGERRGEVAFVQAARFVINEGDAAADHGRDEDGDARSEPASRVFDVLDIRVDLDGLNLDLRGQALGTEQAGQIEAGDWSPAGAAARGRLNLSVFPGHARGCRWR